MAILSLKAYTAIWEADRASSWGSRNNTRQRQLGVNLIIFALTQEKSITKQAMSSMRGLTQQRYLKYHRVFHNLL